MSFEKLAPIKGGSGGCLLCGYQYDILPLGAIIAVGFGVASLTKDGKMIYSENENARSGKEEDFMTAQQAEELAAQDPDHDWRIHLVAPLSERHYQRQAEGHWVLYEKGMGFA